MSILGDSAAGRFDQAVPVPVLGRVSSEVSLVLTSGYDSGAPCVIKFVGIDG